MAFAKKIVILSGDSGAKGMLCLEKNGQLFKGLISLYNLEDCRDGEYLLCIKIADGQSQKVRLGSKGKVNISFNVNAFSAGEEKIAAAVIRTRDNEAEPVMFGANSSVKLWQTGILDELRTTPIVRQPVQSQPKITARESEAADIRQAAPQSRQFSSGNSFSHSIAETEFNVIKSPQNETQEKRIIDISEVTQALKMVEKYNDEAIAGYNYYEPQKMQDTKSGFERQEPRSTEVPAEKTKIFVDAVSPQRYFESSAETGRNNAYSEAAAALDVKTGAGGSWDSYHNIRQEKPKENTVLRTSGEQRGNVKPEKKGIPSPAFYAQKYEEIKKLFENYPPERILNEALPDSHWIRIAYEKDNYYVLGLIGEKPDYIGYGVPGKYSVNPPRELSEHTVWMPLDNKNPKGQGYWLMYQDAETGQSMRVQF